MNELTTGAAARSGPDFRVRVLTELSELEALVPEWDALASQALEPNPFYESWMLLPALQLLVPRGAWQVLVVERASASTPKGARLVGLFPLSLPRGNVPRPLRTLSMLEHRHCFLRTPLLRATAAAEALGEFFAHLELGLEGAHVLELAEVATDGPFGHALIDHQARSAMMSFASDTFTRALFRRAASVEAFHARMPSGLLKDLRRRQRKLEAEGQVRFEPLEPGADPGPWLADFLALEASGWKGRQGSALGSIAADRHFFEAIARAAHGRGRLLMSRLTLDGRPLAMNCNLLALPGGVAFKIAYDERYAKFAPGLLLELRKLETLHQIEGLAWVDSCADRNSEMSNRLWPDRRILQQVRLAATPRLGGLFVSLMPLARWARRHARPDRLLSQRTPATDPR